MAGLQTPQPITLGEVGWLVVGLGSLVAQVLLWLHLLSRVDRSRERSLWRVMCVTVGGPGIILCAETMGVIWYGVQVGRQTATGSCTIEGALWRAVDDFCQWWMDDGWAAAAIAMLLPLWLFARRLRAATRAREM